MNAATTIELLGYVAAALTTISFVPQALQIVRTRNTEGISLGMYSILTAGIALWMAYGFAIGSAPVILANGITLVLATTILTLTVRSRRAARALTDHADRPLGAAGGTHG